MIEHRYARAGNTGALGWVTSPYPVPARGRVRASERKDIGISLERTDCPASTGQPPLHSPRGTRKKHEPTTAIRCTLEYLDIGKAGTKLANKNPRRPYSDTGLDASLAQSELQNVSSLY